MHSNAIWNDVLEVETSEKLLKLRTQTGAFYPYFNEVGTADKTSK